MGKDMTTHQIKGIAATGYNNLGKQKQKGCRLSLVTLAAGSSPARPQWSLRLCPGCCWLTAMEVPLLRHQVAVTQVPQWGRAVAESVPSQWE